MKKVVAIVGSNSESSTNRNLLKYIQKRYQDYLHVELLEIAEIPLFNKPNNFQLPQSVKLLARKIEEADGVIISTPEYDHSVPAVLLNVLAWLSYGIHPLLDKPVMITGASYGTLGSSRAQIHLRQILDSPDIKARLMPGAEFLLGHSLSAFDSQLNLVDEEKRNKLDHMMKDFVDYIEIMEQLRHTRKANAQEVENFSWDLG